MTFARYAGAAVIALTASALGAQTEKAMQHATGTFEVKITPEAQAEPAPGGIATGRMGLKKTFSGGMSGTAVGTMLTAGAPGGAMTYVAIDQFEGTVNGRKGGFILAHRGTMTKAGGGDLSIAISPDSGTGALAGIDGTLSIEISGGVHRYDLAYTLPAQDR